MTEFLRLFCRKIHSVLFLKHRSLIYTSPNIFDSVRVQLQEIRTSTKVTKYRVSHGKTSRESFDHLTGFESHEERGEKWRTKLSK